MTHWWMEFTFIQPANHIFHTALRQRIRQAFMHVKDEEAQVRALSLAAIWDKLNKRIHELKKRNELQLAYI